MSGAPPPSSPTKSSADAPLSSSSAQAAGDAPAAATQARGGSSSSSSSSSTTSSHRGEELSKTWRTLANCLIMASQKADKAASTLAPDVDPVPIDRETDEYVVNYLRTRVKWGRLMAFLEAELEGRARELHSIQNYNRTMPKCSRPRKRARVEGSGVAVEVATLEDVPQLSMNSEDPTAEAVEPTLDA